MATTKTKDTQEHTNNKETWSRSTGAVVLLKEPCHACSERRSQYRDKSYYKETAFNEDIIASGVCLFQVMVASNHSGHGLNVDVYTMLEVQVPLNM